MSSMMVWFLSFLENIGFIALGTRIKKPKGTNKNGLDNLFRWSRFQESIFQPPQTSVHVYESKVPKKRYPEKKQSKSKLSSKETFGGHVFTFSENKNSMKQFTNEQ